jgi:hypothetical protein
MKSSRTPRWKTLAIAAWAACGLAALVGQLGGFANAGSLTPPSGPIKPTHKTLSDIEPRSVLRNDPGKVQSITITESGSFTLGENIIALPGQPGVRISASFVTLDLNGFSISTDPAAPGTSGISVDPGLAYITLRNGFIHGNGGNGISAASAEHVKVDNIAATGNALAGISVGAYASVTRCTVTDNGSNGLFASSANVGVRVEQSNAVGNGASGFSVGSQASLVDCIANENATHGFFAAASTELVRVERSTAFGNAQAGFQLSADSTLVEVSAVENGSHGISAGDQSNIRASLARQNLGSGARVGGNSRVNGSVFTVNAQSGIKLTGSLCYVTENVLWGNAPYNVDAQGSSLQSLITSNLTHSASLNEFGGVTDDYLGAQYVGPWPVSSTNAWLNF